MREIDLSRVYGMSWEIVASIEFSPIKRSPEDKQVDHSVYGMESVSRILRRSRSRSFFLFLFFFLPFHPPHIIPISAPLLSSLSLFHFYTSHSRLTYSDVWRNLEYKRSQTNPLLVRQLQLEGVRNDRSTFSTGRV